MDAIDLYADVDDFGRVSLYTVIIILVFSLKIITVW